MAKAKLVAHAVDPNKQKSITRRFALDALFTYFFKNLVYPQIWEDPEVDIQALGLKDGASIVTIASGGCNVLNYLTAADIKVTAVDINTTHVALNKLKYAAIRHLPSYEALFRFSGFADEKANKQAYQRYIKPVLDQDTLRYWEGRTLSGRRRISMFSRNFYRFGLLGKYIGLVHLVAKLHGKDPSRILEAGSPDQQRWMFENTLSQVFNSKIVRWVCNMPVSVYGLGIPPAQFKELKAASATNSMADVLHERLERLACDHDIKDNYFAWQAFGRRYDTQERVAVPRYLQEQHYLNLKARIGNAEIKNENFGQHLATCDDASQDGYVLLDAQDWMSDQQLNELWSEIDRTAKVGAKVIFRTAGTDTILPGRVADGILSKWYYHQEQSKRLHQSDRSAIYGGFHAYEKLS